MFLEVETQVIEEGTGRLTFESFSSVPVSTRGQRPGTLYPSDGAAGSLRGERGSESMATSSKEDSTKLL